MLLLASAHAAVEVADTTRCLDREHLENELVLLLGGALEDLHVHAWVRPDGEDRSTWIEVREAAGKRPLLWSRSLPATSTDCPALAEAVALAVHGGLEALPGWGWERAGVRRPTWNVGLRGTTGYRGDLRFGAEGGVAVELVRGLGLRAQLRVHSSVAVPVGGGAATLTGASLALGPELRRGRLRGWTLVESGPLWAVGMGFPENRTDRVGLLALEAGAAFHPDGPVYVAAHLGAPLARVRLAEEEGGTWREPVLRAGVSVGLRGSGRRNRDRGEDLPEERASGGR